MDTEVKKGKQEEKILIPLANPDTIEDLMGLSMLIRDAKQKDNLIALSVINDDSAATSGEEGRSKRNLERAAKISAAAGLSLTTVSRYDLNIASGIIHTAKEYGVTDIVIG
ncbi:hypothetical protein J0S40_23935, partial [Escherichia coli]|nr:hypothetical protein [Escherichia coli]